jgi:hypothetical protein
MQTRYPSKRPKVSQVSNWDLIFQDTISNHWRGDAYNGSIQVYRGEPFWDYYKIIYTPNEGKKVTKYMYGESAWSQAEMFVYDLGFRDVLGRI